MSDNNNDQKVVRKVPNKPGVRIGKPRKITASSMMSRYASCGPGGFGGMGGLGMGSVLGGMGGGVAMGTGGNMYSPELSTDFLQLGQSLDEMRQYYRFFYDNDPFVRQAIDVHTELPLSKVRFGQVVADNRDLAARAKRFCMKWAKRVDLHQRLMEIVHEYHKIGEVFIWVEDTTPDPPDEFYDIEYGKDSLYGDVVEVGRKFKQDEATQKAYAEWVQKNYKGWTKIRILPPEQVHLETFPSTDEVVVQLIIDSRTKHYVEQAKGGDPDAQRIVNSMAPEIVQAAAGDGKVTLNTDPDKGSFVVYLARKRSSYEHRGKSILQSCIRTLVYRDKLRQAQTSIASRNMTPTRVIWAENLNPAEMAELRAQVDLSLQDPDFSVIANYQINWEEMSSNGRLLELSGEYDLTDRQLYAGLGTTESLLSGESSYSGDRIKVEVINTRYMLLRELLIDLVEDKFLKPMCFRMGFSEEDEDGDLRILHPTLSFTRLGIKDNDSVFDQLFNLYQKGSLDVWTIFEMLNLDGNVIEERLKKDAFTLNDPNFNEALRSIYSRAGDEIAENSNAAEKIAQVLKLAYTKPPSDAGRFG